MVGRPRKLAPRHPGGKLIQDAGYAPAAVRRLIDSAVRGVADPMYGTPLARLHLENKINATQFAAGRKWDSVRAAYIVAIAAPSPSPSSAALSSTRAEPSDFNSDAGQREAKRHALAVREYDQASQILDACGAQVSRITRELCEGAGVAPLTHAALLKASEGLNALAIFWRLGQKTKI